MKTRAGKRMHITPSDGGPRGEAQQQGKRSKSTEGGRQMALSRRRVKATQEGSGNGAGRSTLL